MCELRHRVTCCVFTEFAVLPDRIQVTKILIRGVGWSRVDGIVFTNKRNSGSCPPHGEHVYELGEKQSKRSQAFWAPRRGVGGRPCAHWNTAPREGPHPDADMNPAAAALARAPVSAPRRALDLRRPRAPRHVCARRAVQWAGACAAPWRAGSRLGHVSIDGATVGDTRARSHGDSRPP